MTVAAVIEQDGRYLLVRERSEGRLVYNQPAGHLEDNESLLEAVVRETLEETAWRFQPEAIIGVYLWRKPPAGPTILRVAFTGTCQEHDPHRTLDEDILRALWMSREELIQVSAYLRSPLVLRCIDDYLTGKRYPLELLSDYIADPALI